MSEEKLGATNRDSSVFKTNYMLISFVFPFLSRQKNLQGKWLGSRHHPYEGPTYLLIQNSLHTFSRAKTTLCIANIIHISSLLMTPLPDSISITHLYIALPTRNPCEETWYQNQSISSNVHNYKTNIYNNTFTSPTHTTS